MSTHQFSLTKHKNNIRRWLIRSFASFTKTYHPHDRDDDE